MIYKINPFCKIEINVSFSKKIYNKKIKKISKDKLVFARKNESGKSIWLEYKNGSPFFMIGIFDKNIDIITHEASHTVEHIMEFLGINDDEFRAYMVGYITEKICDFLK